MATMFTSAIWNTSELTDSLARLDDILPSLCDGSVDLLPALRVVHRTATARWTILFKQAFVPQPSCQDGLFCDHVNKMFGKINETKIMRKRRRIDNVEGDDD